MLPTFGDRCLVGRQGAWVANRYSALAGFVEPGESIEEACAREVKEEAGLTVTAVRYRSSQPWPYPSNLMIGLLCEVSHDEARPDLTELESVRWLTRAEARALVDGRLEGVTAPPPFAIAHSLIRDWAENR
jgi:NAD+ diphosphatase